MTKETISDRFGEADEKRSSLLQRCRDYASLTIPAVLPPAGQSQDDELPACWSNIGGEGMENMVGKVLTSLYPVGIPWFAITPAAEVKAAVGSLTGYGTPLTADQYNEFAAMLYAWELVAASKAEASNYRLAKRAETESLLICGNGLTRMARDYSLRYFRFDNWVCKRSGGGTLLWTITREKKAPIELTPEDRSKAKIKSGDKDDVDLFTLCERVRTGDGDEDFAWRITQEVNEAILYDNEGSEEPVSPYNCVGYRLCPGEDYARGFIATRFPDLKSSNSLWQSLIFGMANAAKMLWVVDTSEPYLRQSDLLKPNGAVTAGRVVQGVVQGAACLQTNKNADFGLAFQGAQAIEQRLGRSMLMETASMPKGERVTAYAVGRIAQELDGALGGPYAHIADESQKPYLARLLYQLERDKIIAPLPAGTGKAMKIDVLTGSAALAKSFELDKLVGAIQLLAPIQGALDRIDVQVLVDRIFQYRGIDTSGLIKTAEKVQAELQQKMMQAAMPEAGKQFVKTVGSVIEQRAAQQQADLKQTGNA